jgi:hypothetical protein
MVRMVWGARLFRSHGARLVPHHLVSFDDGIVLQRDLQKSPPLNQDLE